MADDNDVQPQDPWGNQEHEIEPEDETVKMPRGFEQAEYETQHYDQPFESAEDETQQMQPGFEEAAYETQEMPNPFQAQPGQAPGGFEQPAYDQPPEQPFESAEDETQEMKPGFEQDAGSVDDYLRQQQEYEEQLRKYEEEKRLYEEQQQQLQQQQQQEQENQDFVTDQQYGPDTGPLVQEPYVDQQGQQQYYQEQPLDQAGPWPVSGDPQAAEQQYAAQESEARMDPDTRDFMMSGGAAPAEPRSAQPRQMPATEHEIRPKTVGRQPKHKTTLSFHAPQDKHIPMSALSGKPEEEEPEAPEPEPEQQVKTRFPIALVVMGAITIIAIVILVQFIGRGSSAPANEEVVNKLTRKAQELDKENKKLYKEKKEREDFFKEQLQKERKEKSGIQARLDTVNSKLTTKDDTISDLRGRIRQLELDFKSLQKRNDDYIKTVKESYDKEERLRNDIKDLQAENQRLMKEMAEKDRLIRELSAGSTRIVKTTDNGTSVTRIETDYSAVVANWNRDFNEGDLDKVIRHYSSDSELAKLYNSGPEGRKTCARSMKTVSIKVVPGKAAVEGSTARIPVRIRFLNPDDLQDLNTTMVLKKENGRWLILDEGF